MVVASIVLTGLACTGDDPGVASSSGGSSGTSSSGGSSGTNGDCGGGSGPPAPPSSLSFFDEDMAAGKVKGTLVIGKAADESNVKEYVLSWGSDATTRTAEIERVPKIGNDVSIPFTKDVPANATHLLVAAANANGDLSPVVARAKIDQVASRIDAYDQVATGHALILSGQHLVMGGTLTGIGQNNALLLLRCDLDGAKCEVGGIPTPSMNTGDRPSFAVGTVGGTAKLLIATAQHNAWSCPSDATAAMCQYFMTNPSQTEVGTSQIPSAAFDQANQKIVFAAWDLEPGGETLSSLVLYRCATLNTGCQKAVIAPDGGDASLVLDDATATKRVLAAYVKSGKPTVARCNYLDAPTLANACADVPLSTTENVADGTLQAVIDTKNQKLLVVGEAQANGTPVLFRCALDGTACTRHDLSAGQPQSSGRIPRFAIDTVHDKLLVVGKNEANGNKLSLFRCNLDGSACRHADISAGQSLGASPVLAAVYANTRLFVASGPKFSLYTVTLEE